MMRFCSSEFCAGYERLVSRSCCAFQALCILAESGRWRPRRILLNTALNGGGGLGDEKLRTYLTVLIHTVRVVQIPRHDEHGLELKVPRVSHTFVLTYCATLSTHTRTQTYYIYIYMFTETCRVISFRG